MRAAAAEGLSLVPAASATRWKGVYYKGSGRSRPFEAQIKQDGKLHGFGTFTTAAAKCEAHSASV